MTNTNQTPYAFIYESNHSRPTLTILLFFSWSKDTELPEVKLSSRLFSLFRNFILDISSQSRDLERFLLSKLAWFISATKFLRVMINKSSEFERIAFFIFFWVLVFDVIDRLELMPESCPNSCGRKLVRGMFVLRPPSSRLESQ